MEDEDINHALLHCPSFKDVLQAQLSFLQKSQFQRDFAQVAAQLARRNKSSKIEKLFLGAWGLWYRRNQLIYENEQLSPEQALDHPLSVYHEYKIAAEEQNKGLMPQCRWKPPPSRVPKLNIDGALFHDQCRLGVGMILRDEGGHVIFTASRPEHELSDPMEIELLAVLSGLHICFPLGLCDLQVESDSLLVVQ
ncbi:uncharacterized protein LOC121255162 [Juglans microcarpa x Juglans regia]|uniref:uncharacterized protein LOC121255162 n=1 Tax=Juglans microcarpa x Juglans regia TaxID=2249226 RepID=UPI001B7E7EA4|nr:uncharacterized protein LOC121255162 [Juglans microcarpa x Juglans regia]